MSTLTIEATRSGRGESVHAVSVAVVAKVGAEGIYCAALPALGLGVALKVEDGDMRCSPPALLAVLRQVGERRGLLPALTELRQHAEPVLRTTRGEPIGTLRASGALRFH